MTKTTSTGTIQWQRSLGGISYEDVSSVLQTHSHGYIVAGTSMSSDSNVTGNHGFRDFWILMLDSSGNQLWKKCYGGSGDDYANTMIGAPDGGYVIAGGSVSTNGDISHHYGDSTQSDCWIIKVDSSGTLQWQVSLGGSFDDVANAICSTRDGNYVIAGGTSSMDGDVSGQRHGQIDYWIVKIDAAGNKIWDKTLGGYFDDRATAIKSTTDGGFIIAGYSESADGMVTGNHTVTSGSITHPTMDYWIVKLDSTGTLEWEKSLGGTQVDAAYDIIQCIDGGYVATGITYSNDGDISNYIGVGDMWLVKMRPNGALEWEETFGGANIDAGTSIQELSQNEYIVAGSSESISGQVTGNHGDSDSWLVRLSVPDGLQNINRRAPISVYPDPCFDKIHYTSDAAVISITDLTGRSYDLPHNEEVIDVSTLAQGIYALVLESREGRIVRRFVKE